MTYQRRTVGIVAAIVLALLGTMGLVGYVQGAKDDAVAGEKLVKVYVASDKIPAGTSASTSRRMVTTREGPRQGAGPGRRHQPQVAQERGHLDRAPPGRAARRRAASSRPGAATNAKGVPAGMFGATVSLDPEQALGGQVRAGDHVAIVGVVDRQRAPAATPRRCS